uniref:Sema domain-containing protein n=1 Tax=Macrostomum lignano TaxID=282301 RepID=A0A1I8J3N7_9PLAT
MSRYLPLVSSDISSAKYITDANLASKEKNVYLATFATNKSAYSEADSIFVARNFYAVLKQPWRVNVGMV